MVGSLIHFIYADYVDEASVTWELFEAAKMYELTKLQKACLCVICEKLSVDTCAKMLEGTFKHDLTGLFDYAMEFAVAYKSEVTKTEGWKAVLENPGLVGKMLDIVM